MNLNDLPLRISDCHGEGHWQAPRGSRKHKGIDLCAYPGTKIRAIRSGKATKIGFPYSQDIDNTLPPDELYKAVQKSRMRYVQITVDDSLYRYFYLNPLVEVGDTVEKGQVIGEVQDLMSIYKGMLNHVHFEVKYHGKHINPMPFLEG